MDGVDNLVFENDKNTIRTKDNAIKVEKTSQNSVVADVELHKDDRVVGHAKAFGTLNNVDLQRVMTPYISAIIQISNIQPLFFISSIASQMLVQMGRLMDDPNLYKVAIVTDNVAALRESTQSIIFEKYPQRINHSMQFMKSINSYMRKGIIT